MIGPGDRLELPRGVAIGADGLIDDVRDATLPVNETGRALADSSSLAEMAERCVTRFGAPVDRAFRDAQLFALDLNRRYLLNVHVRGGAAVVALRWLRAALVLARHGTLPHWPARRRALDTASRPRSALGACGASIAPGAGCAAIALLAPVAVGLPPPLALSAALAISAGVAVHEVGHVLLLRGIPAFVGTRGVRVAVIHRAVPERRAAAVALGGPVAGSVCALVLALAGWTLTSVELAVAALGLTPQAVALTVVATDGRRACAL